MFWLHSLLYSQEILNLPFFSLSSYAAVYQTRMQAGDFLVMVEVPSDRAGEFQLLLESAGGEELHTTDSPLPRACAEGCNSPEDLSPEIRTHLSDSAQQVFVNAYGKALTETNDASKAEQAAWETIHDRYDEDENGVWSKEKTAV